MSHYVIQLIVPRDVLFQKQRAIITPRK